jgi:hypothetical protein
LERVDLVDMMGRKKVFRIFLFVFVFLLRSKKSINYSALVIDKDKKKTRYLRKISMA